MALKPQETAGDVQSFHGYWWCYQAENEPCGVQCIAVSIAGVDGHMLHGQISLLAGSWRCVSADVARYYNGAFV